MTAGTDSAITLRPGPLPGLFIAESRLRADRRGSFARLFCSRELEQAHQGRPIVQINHSRTLQKGALRGLHFQHPPAAEAKWVRCIRGRVFDVAVDLRRGSPTFLRWFGIELAPETGRALFLPEGFAHGFQTLEDDSEMLYLHSAPYDPAREGGLRWDDPRLGIDWPLPVAEISDRDRAHPLLTDAFQGLTP